MWHGILSCLEVEERKYQNCSIKKYKQEGILDLQVVPTTHSKESSSSQKKNEFFDMIVE